MGSCVRVYCLCMELLSLTAVALILLFVARRAALTYFRARTARIQMEEEAAFRNETGDYRMTLLVLGDSTGMGVGASRPEESVAGRLAAYIGATHVENYARPGAEAADLAAQARQATLHRYDYLLIQAGGNDIILLHGAKETAKKLAIAMLELPEAGKTILMSAGDVGAATIFPLFVRFFHTLASRAFHRWFSKVAKRRGAVYVDLYVPRERSPFVLEPERFLSKDGLHPSSEGYALWFEKLKEALVENDAAP